MKIATRVLAIALSLVMAFAFVGCKPDPNSGVAATVGDVEIPESDVTALIEYYRLDTQTGSALPDAEWAARIKSATVDASWTEFFKSRGYTSETFDPEMTREYVIRNNLAVFSLMIQKAAEIGIVADQATIDNQMSAIESSASSEGATMESWLRERGWANTDTYRLMLEAYEISKPLAETLIADPTQEEIDKFIRENISTYSGKRLSLMAVIVNDQTPDADARAKMDAAKAKLDAGADFATVVSETCSEDTGLLETGGDIGWGQEASMPAEVSSVLSGLALNQHSDVIALRSDTAGTADDPSDDTVSAYYIVKYTDEYILPEDTSATDETVVDDGAVEGLDANGDGVVDDPAADTTATATPYANLDLSTIPQDLRDTLTTYCKDDKIAAEQQAYWTELAQSDEIVVNPMPEGLSYDVDMSLADTETTDGTTDETATETPTNTLTPIDSAEAVATAESNGLVITDTTVGTGAEALAGDEIQVYYTGTFSDGTVFDSNVGSGAPMDVTIGTSGIIQGFTDGLLGLKVGGTRTVVIPPSMGYGTSDYNTIPGNSILTFEITLVSVNGDSTGYVDNSATAGIDSADTVVE